MENFISSIGPLSAKQGRQNPLYHLLKHLSQRYRIHLGAFIDDESDRKYQDNVKSLCGETYLANLNPAVARVRSLSGFFSGQPLTLPYYRDSGLQRWINDILEARTIRAVLVFSSAMAQYVYHLECAPRIIDFVDVDSDKWLQYSSAKNWPMSWVYRRESRLLLKHERWIAENFSSSTFVSRAEADLFKKLAPNAVKKIAYFNNGVDSDYFSRAPLLKSGH
jgi:sugar transferase (PEP-CTERM/EpsH1 system associated)